MAKLTVKEIQSEAIKLIEATPGGMRYADIVNAVLASHPETPKNTIHGGMTELIEISKGRVVRPSRGLYVSSKATESKSSQESSQQPRRTNAIPEEEFYASFAKWLQNDQQEATIARELGGNGIRGKWGTPDVIGVYKPRASDPVKFLPEFIAAEIKTEPSQSIVAFGQATAYRLFSHRVYLVMPKNMPPDDESRLESLCVLFGIGLVTFTLNPADPVYATRVRASRHEPDMFYVNEFANRLKEHDVTTFNELF